MFKFVDLFAGIGGFRIGLQEIGGTCVFSSEKDPVAASVYKENHGEEPFGDIFDIAWSDVPSHDLLAGGFPCQPFSISGKKAALDDKRADVIEAILGIALAKQPRVVLLENVRHFLHVSGGAALKHLVDSLSHIGYSVSVKEANATGVGIPQNRPRVFILGTLGEANGRPGESQGKSETVGPGVAFRDIAEDDPDFAAPENDYSILDKWTRQRSGLEFCGYIHGGVRGKGAVAKNVHHSRTHRMPYRIYADSGVHPCLSAQESSGRYWVYNRDSGIVRRVTTIEKKRLMGLNDDFFLPDSEAKINKLLGNAVVPAMVSKIAKTVI